MAMTEKEILSFQENIREATQEILDADIGPLRFDDMRFRNECRLCGRPTHHGMEYCNSCRLGPI